MSKTGNCLVGAVDQGTSSTRFLIFNSATSELITQHQTEIRMLHPQEGWVEEDPIEILESVTICIRRAVENLTDCGFQPSDVKCIGITNQRETTVVWDKQTGKPLSNAIVWLDVRTSSTVKEMIMKTPHKDKDDLRPHCGLPLSTYFSAVKLRWLLDNNQHVQKAVIQERCLFGTVDSWLLWNLTGGTKGGKHYTDVTNASRTMLMNIQTLEWDDYLCGFFNIPKSVLPEIRSSSEIYGKLVSGSLQGLPISGILGDQQSALVGQRCLKHGQAKNTYGTGCFLLYNTGTQIVQSKTGLLTTVAYKLGPDKPAVYALEGSIAVTGACVKWLRDNLGILRSSADIETLALQVDSTHGCYFVPAFSGLFCPYWQDSARGIICGISQFTTKQHIARAVLEAVCFQTREILDLMNKESGIPLSLLQVDGGMTVCNLLMQLQADILQIEVVRPMMAETTSLGAAMVAGAAKGIDIWPIERSEPGFTVKADVFRPATKQYDSDQRYARWKLAVEKSMNWEMSAPDSCV